MARSFSRIMLPAPPLPAAKYASLETTGMATRAAGPVALGPAETDFALTRVMLPAPPLPER